jgi:hypothetical protein
MVEALWRQDRVTVKISTKWPAVSTRFLRLSALDSQLASEPAGRFRTHQTMVMGMELQRFHILVVAAVLLYVLIETAYVLRLPPLMDEFQDAATVAAFEGGFSYRDFAAYKTVLGYYLHLPPYLIGSDTWSKLMAVKLAATLLNTACLGITALILARWYARVRPDRWLLVNLSARKFRLIVSGAVLASLRAGRDRLPPPAAMLTVIRPSAAATAVPSHGHIA